MPFEYSMRCIEQGPSSRILRGLKGSHMRRDKSLQKMLRAALRQAARSLESLKLVRADDDPKIARLMEELRSAAVDEDSDREILTTE